MSRIPDPQLELAWASAAGIETAKPPAAQQHSTTSVAAAKRLRPLRLAGDRLKVLGWLVTLGAQGATDEQGQACLGMEGNTYRPRRGELSRAGLLNKCGRRSVASGNPADVWVASDAGHRLYRETQREQGDEPIYLPGPNSKE